MNPRQTLLNSLRMANPEGYNALMSMMRSGKSPEAIIGELLQSGRLTTDQIKMAQRNAALFGITIPDAEIAKVQAVEEKPSPKPQSKFKGLF